MDSQCNAGVAITVCYAPVVGQLWQRHLRLKVGATVGEAITASAFAQTFGEQDPWEFGVGIFNQRVAPDYVLQEGDRVEIYRPLRFDPMELRRRRAALRALKKASTGSASSPVVD